MPSLLDAIFGKQKLEEISLEEIYSVIGEFPSFNAAHFLLSKKLKEENDPAYKEETKKTALYFNNPVWLQLLLNEELNQDVEEKQSLYQETVSDVSPISHPQNEVVAEPQTEPVSFKEELNAPEPEYRQPVEEYSVPTQENTTPAEEEYGEAPEESAAADPGFTEPIQEYNKAPEQDNTEPAQDFSEPEYKEPVPELSEAEPDFTESVQEYKAPIHHPPSTINEEYQDPEITINEEFAEARESGATVNQELTEDPQPVVTVNEEYALEEANIPTVNQEFAGETDREAFDRPSQPFPEPPAATADETIKPQLSFDVKKAESIVFAPYHMIDYFASQGIKLVLEDQPSDNFGKQLKSFTDWLKVMKRLPQKQLMSEKTDEREAERIRHFAANSIEERDILTETMAEVLAKQGMYENAIALYQKLSLIYPPKSAYFASRIEQLKASLS
ncbi:MAG: hypothetical protein ACHQDF_00815 [Chitinophagales bacterium]